MNDLNDKFIVVIQILGQMLSLMEEKHKLLNKKELLSPADVMVLICLSFVSSYPVWESEPTIVVH